MSQAENRVVDRHYAEQVWNGGNLSAIEEYIAPDYIRHDPGLPMEVRGPEGIRAIVPLYRAAFPDIHFTAADLIADGDKVVVRWNVVGTHQGELMGIAATGRPIALTAIEIFRLDAGLIVEQWVAVDNLGLLQQIGALPAPT